MRFRHRIGVRCFESSKEWPLPKASISEACSINVDWTLAADPLGAGTDGLFVREEDGYVVQYEGHLFCLRPETGEASVFASPGTTIRESALFLVDAVWPGILALRGTTVLHAASASLYGRGVLIVGESGSGKSTLAMALSRAGFDLLGDEWAPVAEDLRVEPSNAAFRLGEEWATALGVKGGGPAAGKTRIEASSPQPSAKPIAAVALLETGSGSVSAEEAPAAWAFSRLMESCFRPDTERSELLDAQIEIITRLINEVPVVNLRYPHRIESTGEAAICLRRLLERK